MTDQEVYDMRAADIRVRRNILLSASDWTHMVSDRVVENQAAWATYRQSLRDISTQAEFPNTVNWPVEPE